jgi:hypothetical protein
MPQRERYKRDTNVPYPELPGDLGIVLINERERNEGRTNSKSRCWQCQQLDAHTVFRGRFAAVHFWENLPKKTTVQNLVNRPQMRGDSVRHEFVCPTNRLRIASVTARRSLYGLDVRLVIQSGHFSVPVEPDFTPAAERATVSEMAHHGSGEVAADGHAESSGLISLSTRRRIP